MAIVGHVVQSTFLSDEVLRESQTPVLSESKFSKSSKREMSSTCESPDGVTVRKKPQAQTRLKRVSNDEDDDPTISDRRASGPPPPSFFPGYTRIRPRN